MKIIYVASPYAGDIQRNTAFAKKACRHVLEQGHAFFAPHLLYPQLLDDTDPQERQAGLDMGLAMLPKCDELWCYGDDTSSGMRMEIEEANRLSIPVRRGREQNNIFHIRESKEFSAAEAPTPSLGMV
jgi:hypothetical protein